MVLGIQRYNPIRAGKSSFEWLTPPKLNAQAWLTRYHRVEKRNTLEHNAFTPEAHEAWKEMTLRRKLNRLGYELVKAHDRNGEIGYQIEDSENNFIIAGLYGNELYSFLLDDAIRFTQAAYKNSGMEYGSFTEPERMLEDYEDEYIERKTEDAEEYFYFKAEESADEELFDLEADGVRVSERHRKQIKVRWNQWAEDMTENVRQNLIAECLDEDPYDNEEVIW